MVAKVAPTAKLGMCILDRVSDVVGQECDCVRVKRREEEEGWREIYLLLWGNQRERIATTKYVSREKYDFRLSRYLFEMLNADEPQVASLGPLLSNGRPPNGWRSLDRSHVSAKSSQLRLISVLEPWLRPTCRF